VRESDRLLLWVERKTPGSPDPSYLPVGTFVYDEARSRLFAMHELSSLHPCVERRIAKSLRNGLAPWVVPTETLLLREGSSTYRVRAFAAPDAGEGFLASTGSRSRAELALAGP
jgi:hypothetical protein